ncbi:unnamed protein product [Moneuplotes crassus]|uniref:Uncharacterized protein n=1 Tax=Euplotes crassus TaxID=5936 RepID=A0AAD1U1U5_EUPCR|nr:unnamed protein product [Moneuplotes crassus]
MFKHQSKHQKFLNQTNLPPHLSNCSYLLLKKMLKSLVQQWTFVHCCRADFSNSNDDKDFVQKFKKNDVKYGRLNRKFKKLLVFEKKKNKNKIEDKSSNFSRLCSISKTPAQINQKDSALKQINIQSSKTRNKVVFKPSRKTMFNVSSRKGMIKKTMKLKNSKTRANTKIKILKLGVKEKKGPKKPSTLKLKLSARENYLQANRNSLVKNRENTQRKREKPHTGNRQDLQVATIVKWLFKDYQKKQEGLEGTLTPLSSQMLIFKNKPNPIQKVEDLNKESEKLRSRSHIYKYLSGDYMKSFTTGLQYDVKVAHNQTKHEACLDFLSSKFRMLEKDFTKSRDRLGNVSIEHSHDTI